MNVQVKRGRPRKQVQDVSVKTVRMNSLNFDSRLFKPLKSKTKIDNWFSSNGGIMPGTMTAVVGDPGAGKTTVLLDVLSQLQKAGKKVLFISGEMNSIDMYGYVKRYPKFGKLDILFMSEYLDNDPFQVIETALSPGYDVVLVDSMMEIADQISSFSGGTNKGANSRLLTLFEQHNKGNNESNEYTAFLLIQQVTKSGGFAGSNKFKHMVSAMCHLKIDVREDRRYLYFSKNRRGGKNTKLYFNLSISKNVRYEEEAPLFQERGK